MSGAPSAGALCIVGVGPGDPELMTLKAHRIIAAAGVVAAFSKHGRPGHAWRIAAQAVRPEAETLHLAYPFTTEVALDDPAYRDGIDRFHDDCAARLAALLADGRDVVLLCEGDPLFYGSSMALFDRLRSRFDCSVVPGITAMSGCWTAAGVAMAHGDDVLTVLPGTLPGSELARRLAEADAAVVMKVGRNLPKIRTALVGADRLERAVYVEQGTMAEQVVMPLAERDDAPAPYFSIVLVPGRQGLR